MVPEVLLGSDNGLSITSGSGNDIVTVTFASPLQISDIKITTQFVGTIDVEIDFGLASPAAQTVSLAFVV